MGDDPNAVLNAAETCLAGISYLPGNLRTGICSVRSNWAACSIRFLRRYSFKEERQINQSSPLTRWDLTQITGKLLDRRILRQILTQPFLTAFTILICSFVILSSWRSLAGSVNKNISSSMFIFAYSSRILRIS